MPRHRTHVVLSVWPLAVLFAVGLFRLWPALSGATSYAAESPASWVSLIVHTLVVLVALTAYARGWSLLSSVSDDGAALYRSAGCARLQKLAGAVAWAFVVAHLAFEWFMSVRVGPVALSHYELMRSFVSRPLVLGACALGLGAVGLFLSQGLAASFRAWGVGRKPESSRRLEVLCTLTSAMAVLLAVNVLSHFVTGRAYWSGSFSVSSSGAEGSAGEKQ